MIDSNNIDNKSSKTSELMKDKGFKISPKKDPLKEIIENYKKHISKTELKDEIYKKNG